MTNASNALHVHKASTIKDGVLSNPTLNTPSDGAATISLGNLFPCLSTLTVKNFFLLAKLNLPFSSLKPLPLIVSLRAVVKSPFF